MPRLHLFSLVSVVGLSGISAAQGQYDFQTISLPNTFNISSINNSGAIAGRYGNTNSIWTAQNGVTAITTLTGDNYYLSISDTGHVYGISGGSLISFDAQNGRQVLASDPNISYSVTALTQDKVLLRGNSSYYTYDSTGLHSLATPSGFTPNQILKDGTIIGLVQNGTNPVGVPAFDTMKLSGDGSLTLMPGSQQSFTYHSFSYNWTSSQVFDLLGDGYSYVETNTWSQQTSQSTFAQNFKIIGPGNASYTADASYYSSNIGGFNSGFAPSVVLNDGTMIGSDMYPARPLTIYSFANPAGVVMDSSYFTGDSIIPDHIVMGTHEGMMLGQTLVNNQWVYSMTTVPEPTSFMALGLGVLALARRRRQK